MAYLTTSANGSVLARVQHVFQTLAERSVQRRIYRETLNELNALSDRELADLGLTRFDLGRVAREAAGL